MPSIISWTDVTSLSANAIAFLCPCLSRAFVDINGRLVSIPNSLLSLVNSETNAVVNVLASGIIAPMPSCVVCPVYFLTVLPPWAPVARLLLKGFESNAATRTSRLDYTRLIYLIVADLPISELGIYITQRKSKLRGAVVITTSRSPPPPAPPLPALPTMLPAMSTDSKPVSVASTECRAPHWDCGRCHVRHGPQCGIGATDGDRDLAGKKGRQSRLVDKIRQLCQRSARVLSVHQCAEGARINAPSTRPRRAPRHASRLGRQSSPLPRTHGRAAARLASAGAIFPAARQGINPLGGAPPQCRPRSACPCAGAARGTSCPTTSA